MQRPTDAIAARVPRALAAIAPATCAAILRTGPLAACSPFMQYPGPLAQNDRTTIDEVIDFPE